MIYDTVISTGDKSISGCSSQELGTNTFNSGNLIAAGGQGASFYFNTDFVTGQTNIKINLNGQTLLQEVPVTGLATNFTFYSNKTGDFFIKGEEAPENDQSRLFFDKSTPVFSDSKLVYDVVTGGNFAATGDEGGSLKTSIQGVYPAFASDAKNFGDFEYFLNGQKVYSGAGVGVSSVQEPNFSQGGGVVTSSNKNKFKYTAYRKASRTNEITGIEPDIFGSGFIEGRNKYYINGIQQPKSDYLELYTGVSIIRTGLTSLMSGSINDTTVTTITL